jgi:quercetin dioxygenase-like cupin family protein
LASPNNTYKSMRFKLVPLFLTAAAMFAAAGHGVIIDNDSVKVINAVDAPGKKGAMHQHTVNRVMIYLDAGHQRIVQQDGKVRDFTVKAGEVRFDPAGGLHTSENAANTPLRIVEVELKKPHGNPVSPTSLDPVKLDPKHYKVEFENDQVRVIRAHYGPHESGPLHQHLLPRVTVFLTAQNMKVTTADGKSQEAHAEAGDVKWALAAKHSEQNLSDRPFEVIAVELK